MTFIFVYVTLEVQYQLDWTLIVNGVVHVHQNFQEVVLTFTRMLSEKSVEMKASVRTKTKS